MVNGSAYVSQVVHKTYIEVDEKGTKAAASTGIIVEKNAIVEAHSVVFDKPFAYIIIDQKTKEILFFGVVHEPNIWHGETCK